MENKNKAVNTKNDTESGNTLLGVIVLILIGVAVWHFWGGSKSIVGTWKIVGMQTQSAYEAVEDDEVIWRFDEDETFIMAGNGQQYSGTYKYDDGNLYMNWLGGDSGYVQCEIDGDKMVIVGDDGETMELKRQ